MATSGKTFLLSVGNTATGSTTWTPVLSSRSDSYTHRAETLDSTSKANAGYSTFIQGFKSFNVSLEGVIENDAGQELLAGLFESGEAWDMKVSEVRGDYTFAGVVTEFSASGSYNAVQSFTVTVVSANAPTWTAAP